jgi:CDP-diacylglycerol pyrophosphatase
MRSRSLLALTRSLTTMMLCLSPAAAHAVGERGALWHVVDDLCLPMHRVTGMALPCQKVDAARGFVVIRAPGDVTRIIVVPTVRMTGIESPALLRESAPNYWSFAWDERHRVIAAARRELDDWTDLGMAINSQTSRTQDQLHIHVDCVDARLKRALAANAARLTQRWATLDLPVWGRRYRVRQLGAEDLRRDVFQMVAAEIPGARRHMGRLSIAVVGDKEPGGARGFAVLVNDAHGHAEELLDHACKADRE